MWWQSLLGLAAFPLLAWLFGERRQAVRLRVVAAGLALQLVAAGLFLKLSFFQEFFLLLNQPVMALDEATRAGTAFVFGYLGGGPLPFAELQTGSPFILAFRALPLLLVISALSALLFYWRILPHVVRAFAWILHKSLGISGALGFGAAANVFVGMTEAPLLIRPYLQSLSRGELFALMTCGMATIAGTVMVVYAGILGQVIPGIMGHLLIASVLSAPAAITVAHIMVPDDGSGITLEGLPPSPATGSMDAITQGTLDGMRLFLNIIALLIVLVALVHIANQLLALLPAIGGEALSLQRLFAWIMAPLTWLMGIPWAEAHTAGSLMGIKTVLNEFLAYLELAKLPEGSLSSRSELIMTYALCGFANFGSLGIMIGGLASLMPERRSEIVGLGMRSLVAGTLAVCLTGAMAGIFI